MEKVLKLENVTVLSGSYKVLSNINLEIVRNTFNIITGPSGAGKSTLLKTLAGLIEPNSGKVFIREKDYFKISEEERVKLRRKISFVFQNSALISNLTIKENLILPIKFHYPNISDSDLEKVIFKNLEKVGCIVDLACRPAELSFGEQKLVSIARAMTLRPEILFIDEPFSYVDPTIAKKLIDIIKEYSDLEWTTVIIVTYNKEIFSKTDCNIIYIDSGELIFNKNRKELLENNNIENLPEVIKDIFLNNVNNNI